MFLCEIYTTGVLWDLFESTYPLEAAAIVEDDFGEAAEFTAECRAKFFNFIDTLEAALKEMKWQAAADGLAYSARAEE